jgi:hypothetical protein
MAKIAPETQTESISELPMSQEDLEKKQRDESVAALREFFKELFRYLFTLFCFTLVIFLDSNWSQKHSDCPRPSLALFVNDFFAKFHHFTPIHRLCPTFCAKHFQP